MNSGVGGKRASKHLLLTAALGVNLFAVAGVAQSAVTCGRTVVANVVAIDQPVMFNRLGASNINGMIYALERDVVLAGGVEMLRPDKRPRPLVLRVRTGDCLTVNLRNGLRVANPNQPPINIPPLFNTLINNQVADRHVSMFVTGMQYMNGPDADDGAFVGNNADNTVPQGGTKTYTLYAEKEGAFAMRGMATTVGSDANQGNAANLLFGSVIVQPKNSAIYRSQITQEEMRLASLDLNPASPTCGAQNQTPAGHPVIDYEARYPAANCNTVVAGGTGANLGADVWVAEGKAGLPVVNMINVANSEIVHSEINAFVGYGPSGALSAPNTGPHVGQMGHYPPDTYPLESVGKRNPTVPNRLEPFRDFASIFHDEPATKQAFPGFYEPGAVGGSDVFRYVLAGVKDGFMINYGSGGIGSEILANRLGVGPMHDCLTCAYEEFFLTSYTVGDPAMLVDIPANFGLEACNPAGLGGAACAATGPKATKALYTEDPSNVHHSYTGDFTKFRNVHVGAEQHVFHLHNHQWLYNPNDDNSNYLDAQGIGPGAGYTYEINFGGSGNRNKTSGDAIFHCHFYPHFAQGMWYHWRNHDTFEAGTELQTSVTGGGFHVPFTQDGLGLGDGTPAPGARALPDAEIVAGAPIPALVPLPGKAMAPMPGAVSLKPNPLLVNVIDPGTGAVVGQQNAGSLADVARPLTVNPGYPFWVAGIEDIVGQRPPTPPLDMASAADVAAAKAQNPGLFANLVDTQAGGWDGGLPRAALQGYAAGGADLANVISPIDFTKAVGKAQAVFYPEAGTDVEQLAMATHGKRCHDTYMADGSAATCADPGANEGGFILNGQLPAIGAPFNEPCVDDLGQRLGNGSNPMFFNAALTTAGSAAGMSSFGSSPFNADNPRIYKGANIQYDAVLNKVGYHYPQQRIIALWEDAVPIITKAKPGEPLVMRLNTFDCAVFQHTNLVPEVYEADDYQVRTPTDIIGQHIHLPKWDLTTADGSANGWNYEDGTLSPGAVQERIHALNCFVDAADCPAGVAGGGGAHLVGSGSDGLTAPTHLSAKAHPYFAGVAPAQLASHWVGARTTLQRWFADPVVNTDGEDRGLGIIFTHDHYGPSTHQQVGLYATVLVEPAGSAWAHNETGEPLYTRPDGGPTSWQATVIPPANSNVAPFREFYFEYADFQHAYEAGVYVGAGQLGEQLPGVGPGAGVKVANLGNPDFDNNPINAFRFAINPPARVQHFPVMPDLVLEAAGGHPDAPGCPVRPCPQAIDVQDPGMMVVNYRNEPLGLRVYDPNKIGPDGKPGMQADGPEGDLALAMLSRTDRVIPQLNVQPDANTVINGTRFPPPINAAGVNPGDPFTPMVRAYTGDVVRVKMQAGAHEEEHNATIHGLKWLQAGSGHGRAGNSGWRGAQAGGISEQFTLAIPPVPVQGNRGNSNDYAYSMDYSHDGMWSGMWGILRAYNNAQDALVQLPTTVTPVKIANAADFDGPCPINAPVRNFDITALLANTALPDNPDVGVNGNIVDPSPLSAAGLPTDHVGTVPLDPAGGSLVYNNRAGALGQGPIHDPTAILYFHSSDLVPIDPTDNNCLAGNGNNRVVDANQINCPVRLAAGKPVEPLVIRAAAGECIEITLRNKLPPLTRAVNFATGRASGTPVNAGVPDLATLSSLLGVVKRDRFNPLGATTFQTNLIRASGYIGLHPQMMAYDVSRHNGVQVGENPNSLTAPGQVSQRIRWYAGDLSHTADGNQFTLNATPVEFGGANIQPVDPIKQGQKALVGTTVVEPQGATWVEDVDLATCGQPGEPRCTRTGATVNNSYRDFSLVISKALTHYYADGTPVEHINGEGMGIPEDSQDASAMSMNYGIEPLWFRFGILPNVDFGNATALGTFGAQTQFDVFSNAKVGGDPVTPVFVANAGQPTRIRVTNAYGTSRGSTFYLHGHVWQRDPYVCAGTKDNIPGRCSTTEVGSTAIGDNKQAFYQGAQESIAPGTHFDVVLPSAGGANAKPGDYKFGDFAAPGNASGLWGILRVK
ncbi:MAG: hypothetical protein OEZ68_04060 [Gammaproteobacteria bacterium]|nr:hypothetical protein [Gammaproteobacteria bacterium]MDH5799961.1 hypothetical protein [Gammaproteobacteria bacterium]